MSRLEHSEGVAEAQNPESHPEMAATGSSGTGIKRTVDELMQDHVDFLATCLKECMLTNSKLLRVSVPL